MEYCRCWQVFLHNTVGSGNESSRIAFMRHMRDNLPHGTWVHRWPSIWPEVESIFRPFDGTTHDAIINFVLAVQDAERFL